MVLKPPPSPTTSNFIAGRPKAAPPFCLLLVVFCFFSLYFQARFIVVVSFVSICLVCESSIVATCPSMPSARFVFLFELNSFCFCCSFFFVNQSRTKGEGWSTANKFKHPSNFIAGRPKPALLCWFLCDFRCHSGVLLFFVILVIYKYRNK